MGNTIYAEALVGMTVVRAERFIGENNVYFDANHTKYRIMKICVSYPNSIDTKVDCPNILNVKVENNVISKILYTG